MAKSQGTRSSKPADPVRSDIVDAEPSSSPPPPPSKPSKPAADKQDPPPASPPPTADPEPLTVADALTPECREYLAIPANRRPAPPLAPQHDGLAAQVLRFAGQPDRIPELETAAQRAHALHATESQRLLREANAATEAVREYKRSRARARGAETELARSAPAPLAAEFAAAVRQTADAQRSCARAQREAEKWNLLVGQSDKAIARLAERLASGSVAGRSDRAPVRVRLEEAQKVRDQRHDHLTAAQEHLAACGLALEAARVYESRARAAAVGAMLDAVEQNPPAPAKASGARSSATAAA